MSPRRCENRWIFAAPLAGLLFYSLFDAPTSLGEALPGKWVEVRTDHFVVISNAGPRQSQKVATHFEQIRELLARALPKRPQAPPTPLRVYAAADERTMKRLLPQAWEVKNQSRPAGVFRKTPTGTDIAVRADLVGGDSFGIVYHEYFHFVANQTGLPLPTWLSEGLADYWGGGTRLTGKFAEVGRPIKYHLERLQASSLLPLDVLMTADRSSPHYRRRTKVGLFYAQSWALTHMILIGDATDELRQQLLAYLPLVAQGVDSRSAATQAFGDLSRLQSKLRAYVRKLLFRYAKLPAPPKPPKERLRLRDLPRAEAAALVARFLMAGNRTRDAGDLIALAVEGAPAAPLTQEAAGLYHLRSGELEAAKRAFEQAVGHSDAGPITYYGLAILRFHEDWTAGGLQPESLVAIERRLREALALRQDFAPAFARLAEVYRRLDSDTDRALAAIRRALDIEPDHAVYRLKQAQTLLAAGDVETAARIARSEAEEAAATQSGSLSNNVCWHGSIWGLADAVLPACEHSVEMRPDSRASLDSRGVARALTGDFAGALIDLRAAREMGEDAWPDDLKAKRDAWIAALEQDADPFAGRGFAVLRDDPGEEGIGWLR